MIDNYFWKVSLSKYQPHLNQHAYPKKKSSETALYQAAVKVFIKPCQTHGFIVNLVLYYASDLLRCKILSVEKVSIIIRK